MSYELPTSFKIDSSALVCIPPERLYAPSKEIMDMYFAIKNCPLLECKQNRAS